MRFTKSVQRVITFDIDDPYQLKALEALNSLPRGARGKFLANLLYERFGDANIDAMQEGMLEVTHKRFAERPAPEAPKHVSKAPESSKALRKQIGSLKL